MIPTGSTFDSLISFGVIGLFLAGMIAVLYTTNKQSHDFADYAVGGRSYGPWYIAMCYTNSWWPGATFTAFFSLSVGGALGFYGMVYSTLGVTAMYLMANRAWSWGKRFNLTTQPDLLGMRFNSPAVKRLASIIGIISVFPWVVMGIQALAMLFQFASYGGWGVTACLSAGVLVVLIRQYWTVSMGMRGLIMTDMYQGLIAYVLAAALCIFLLGGSEGASFSHLAALPAKMLLIPGDTGTGYGAWYMFSLIFTGVIGSMCWPMSFQRIYTASGVRSVKKGTVYTILLVGGFYGILMLFAAAVSQYPNVAAHPQQGWFLSLFDIGGPWLLAVAIAIVLAASIGHVDGCVQVCGVQFANDLATWTKPRTDRQLTALAKGGMIVFIVAAAIVAYLTFNYSRLQLLAQISYQGIIQLAVPLFFGLFTRWGNKQGAILGMLAGIVIAIVLTTLYPDDIPALGSLTSGIVGVAVNALVFVACALVLKPSEAENRRVAELFDSAAPQHLTTKGGTTPVLG
ncbi:sodium:solute symporter family protein [Pseudomonas typographi]|uniref:sodium:solute symporter family protein n=1 Tax=Pseudomonas typographi TaxID=2715964 RepID=UPI001683A662|nr:sodium:solute symporter family protein [Pseudomonas typographi]MBD1551494.1 sodium:solute symporter family protein [Pseudomonas typographi]MBD1587520.1 sodium:solute symporter family protein [Pseudomonas typographi]